MSWLQNDMFNEQLAEARAEEEDEDSAILMEFDREVSEDRIYEDINIDDEVIESAINHEYWDTAWYAISSRDKLVEELMQLRQGGRR